MRFGQQTQISLLVLRHSQTASDNKKQTATIIECLSFCLIVNAKQCYRRGTTFCDVGASTPAMLQSNLDLFYRLRTHPRHHVRAAKNGKGVVARTVKVARKRRVFLYDYISFCNATRRAYATRVHFLRSQRCIPSIKACKYLKFIL